MPKTMRAGLFAAILVGSATGTILIAWDATRRLLATDRDWTLAPRSPVGGHADGFGPDGY